MRGPAGVEIERRHLLDRAPAADELLRIGARASRLEQVYLLRTDDWVRRVRTVGTDELTRYVATRKRDIPGVPGGIAREEIEEDLGAEDYRRLVAQADPTRRAIRKTRHVIAWRRWQLELDVFSDPPALVMLEVELDDPSQVPDLPDEIRNRVVREVTDDPRYTNYGLSLLEVGAGADLRRA